jgi:UDP-glucose 4-epimerase
MKYLVTGGAGFIGSHIVDALVAEDHKVVVLDNLSSGHRENLASVMDRIAFIEGDIRDADSCIQAADGCDGIFHEAALVSVADSVERPRDNHDINITGTLNVLEAARSAGVRRVVFASSAAIYGNNPELPKTEAMLPEPMSPYAVAKITGEHYLKTYAELYGLECIALRYFNVYGPRQDPSSPYSGVISIFARRVGQGLPVTIYGDGEQTRDFINVADVISANLLAMQTELSAIPPQVEAVTGNDSSGASTGHDKIQNNGRGQLAPRSMPHAPCAQRFVVLNVATGRARSLLDLLGNLEEQSGKKVERSFAPARAGDIRHSVACSQELQDLGWRPSIHFKEGLRALV